MKYLEKFDKFVNESKDMDKVFLEAEQWAISLGFSKIEKDEWRTAKDKQYYFAKPLELCLVTKDGTWTFAKHGSRYLMEWPDSRMENKSVSLKKFKSLFEEIMPYSDIMHKYIEFLELTGIQFVKDTIMMETHNFAKITFHRDDFTIISKVLGETRSAFSIPKLIKRVDNQWALQINGNNRIVDLKEVLAQAGEALKLEDFIIKYLEMNRKYDFYEQVDLYKNRPSDEFLKNKYRGAIKMKKFGF